MKYLKPIILTLFVSILCLNCNAQDMSSKSDKKIIVAYVTSWSRIMPDPAYMTHINYAFGHVNNTFDGIRIDNEERLKSLVNLKKDHPSLKIILSIGGWGSGRFSEMAANEEYRKSFAKDCKRVIDEFGLDGVDLDWEYPTSNMAGISASPDDTKNFTLLMRDIRAEISKSKLLTLATAANAKYIDFKGIDPYIDFVNIMTYDMGTPPYHHAGLYRSSKYTRGQSVAEAVEAHVDAGMPINKLVLGMPFYGRGGKDLKGFTNYKNLSTLTDHNREWDDEAKAPYLTNKDGEFVCTYDDPRSIALKCQFIIDKGMLGAMYWDYDGDDNDGTLRKAVYNGVNKK